MRTFRSALRLRLRNWTASLCYVAVVGAAITLVAAWTAISSPLLRGATPYVKSHQLIAVSSWKAGQSNGLAWGDIDDFRSVSVTTIAGFLPRTWALQTEPHGHVEVALSLQVTGQFFRVLGVQPWIGTPLSREYEQIGNQNWAWLSYESWVRYFGGGRNLGDRKVWINSVAYRVAGVMPRGFVFPHDGENPDIYIPLNRAVYCCIQEADTKGAIWRGSGPLWVIARMTDGVTRRQFDAELKTRSQVLATVFPSDRDTVFAAQDLAPFLLGDRLRMLQWFGIAAGIFFLIGNANAGGIWLAQWRRYQRQVSIQLSLGAPVRRIFADQLAQTAILALAAGIIGLIGANLLLTAIRYSPLLGPELNHLELWSKARLDPLTVVAALAATIFASLVTASLPLLFTRWDSLRGTLLANPGSGTGRSANKLRVALAIAQLTLTAVLSYAGILVARNIHVLLATSRGFQTEHILQAGIGISESRYNTDERMIDFHRRAIEELRRVPGVMDAGGGVDVPVSKNRTRFLLDDETLSKSQQPVALLGIASPTLLPMLGVPLLRGRMFEEADRWQSPHVALVNEAFEARYLRGRNPIGRSLRIGFYNGFAAKPYGSYTIVGVIANTHNRYFMDQPDPQIVISSTQIALEGFRYFVKTTLPASELLDGVRKAIWKVDPEVERVRLTPLEAFLERALVTRRTVATLAGWFAALAVLVVGFGVSASLSATFQEQLRDLSIRAALGATGVRLAYESVKWGAISVAVSWFLALPLSFAVSTKLVLDGIRFRWDLESWMGVGLVLGVVGLAAAYLPARRSALVDPATMLRSE